MKPTIEHVTVVAAAEGSKLHAVLAVPGIGTGGLKMQPLPAGSGSVNFVVEPSLISTVMATADVFARMTEVR